MWGFMMRLMPAWLLGLLLALPAAAQEVAVIQVDTLPTSLAGDWLFRPGNDPAWASPFRERRGWQPMAVPGSWERQGYRGHDGHAWYRIQFFVSGRLAGQEIGLDLGLVADVDEVFLNGRLVGSTGSFPPRLDRATLARRFYQLPRDMIRFGDRNELAIHVFNQGRGGGLLGPGPRLHRQDVLQTRQVLREAALFSLAAFLLALFLLQAWVFLNDPQRLESLFFALFVGAVAVHSLSHANWGLSALFSHSFAYRLHIASQLAATSLAPKFMYSLARRTTPFALRILQGVLGLGAVTALLWQGEGDLFFWSLAARVASIFLAIVLVRLLLKLLQQRRPFSLILMVTTLLFVAAVAWDTFAEFRAVSRKTPWLLEVTALVGLAPVCAFICLALMQNWFRDRCGEAGETASGIIPWDRFMGTLARELERSRRSGNPLTVSFVRITRGGISLAPETMRGDAVGTVRRSLRHMDILTHAGEDTLCCLLPETDERTAMATLERLRRTINTGTLAKGSRLATTAGVAEFRPARHVTAVELVQEAEAALYAAINEGGDCTATAP